ncbi:MAG: class I SAM-dependent methyltransferase [Candidatus Methanomethyliaceae archaeon]|nr:class I SAM-dependent methyltransferase [Candidatus Methanomethyliaceae archaeon]MDW7971127.1 class I SAM-dependent methyltransferase [Nitrososphaerota archaeon]
MVIHISSEYDAWARVYDIIYGGYKEDIEFYRNEAKKSKGKVLEIGCGTGRIYLELLKNGIDVYGIDISKKMLEELRKKARRMGLMPKVRLGDMRNFRFREKFSLIIVPFRSFLYNLTTEDQLKTLRNFKRHLIDNGRLILNFFYPDIERMMSMSKESEELIVTDMGKYVVREKSYFVDEINQIVETSLIVYKDGKLFWRGSYRFALIYKREFELLLRVAGFKKWSVYGGFNYEPLKSYKQEMVWIAENI